MPLSLPSAPCRPTESLSLWNVSEPEEMLHTQTTPQHTHGEPGTAGPGGNLWDPVHGPLQTDFPWCLRRQVCLRSSLHGFLQTESSGGGGLPVPASRPASPWNPAQQRVSPGPTCPSAWNSPA